MINLTSGTLSAQHDDMKMGKGDFTLNMYRWQAKKDSLQKQFRQDASLGKRQADAPIISFNWSIASHLDYYIGYYTGQEGSCIGRFMNIHQYYLDEPIKKAVKCRCGCLLYHTK
jgi:hypothetical protein